MNSHGAQKKALGLKPAPSYNLRCLYGYVLRGLDIFLGGMPRKIQSLTFMTPTPIFLAWIRRCVLYQAIISAACMVMWSPLWTFSLGGMPRKIQSLTFMTPTPIFLAWIEKVCSAPSYNLRCLYGHVVPWLEFPFLECPWVACPAKYNPSHL